MAVKGDPVLNEVGVLPVAQIPEHGADKQANVTRYLFVPAAQALGDGTAKIESTGDVPIMEVVNTSEIEVYFPYFRVPSDWVSFSHLYLIWNASSAGNMYWSFDGVSCKEGLTMSLYADRPGYGVTAGTSMGKVDKQEPEHPLTLPSLAADHFVSIKFKRNGTHELDTIEGVVNLIGILFEYTAEQ